MARIPRAAKLAGTVSSLRQIARRPRPPALALAALLAAGAAVPARAEQGDAPPRPAVPPAPSPSIGAGPSTPAAASPAAGEPASAASLGLKEKKLDIHAFKVAESQSGPHSYYRLIEDPAEPYIRAVYRPPLETVTVGTEVPENLRQATKRLRWKWRAMVMPKGGNECKPGYGDSAAVVYVIWKRGLKWYSLKYVWSPFAPKGETCDRKRNLFVVQDTVVARSGGPTGVWATEDVDPSAEFRAHFENGDPKADVPDFVGVGFMTDGDDTKSVSAADYGGFSILY